jgi:hypothetical protein
MLLVFTKPNGLRTSFAAYHVCRIDEILKEGRTYTEITLEMANALSTVIVQELFDAVSAEVKAKMPPNGGMDDYDTTLFDDDDDDDYEDGDDWKLGGDHGDLL